MACSNEVVRFALSDANGISGFSISSKVEAGAAGLLVRGSTEVGGVCTDYSGNIYVSDAAQHCILKIDEGGRISNFAGTPGTSGNNSALTVNANSAEFDTPLGLACDKSGNIYVADSGNNQIRVIHSGKVSLVAGDGAAVAGFTDGVGAASKFNNPKGVAVTNSGVLYVSDTDNHAVRKIVDAQVLTVAGDITGPTAGDAENVKANKYTATFSSPSDVVVDPEGNVYVLDTGNRKIKKLTPNGWVYLHSGSGAAGTSIGTGNTRMYTCQYNELAFGSEDRSGNLYVVDFAEGSTRLVKIDYSGNPNVVADFAGSGSDNCPVAVAVSPAQKLFVTLSDYQEGLHSSSSESSQSSQSSESSSESSSSESSSSSSESSSSTESSSSS